MKKKLTAVMLLTAGLFLIGLTSQQEPEQELQFVEPLVSENEDLKIWMVSDIHYLSPTLIDDGEAFEMMKATGAGKDIGRMSAIMDALVWQADREKPDLLIVSGDLTFNGEYQSMVELASYFAKIEANGTQVSVIPGNHDIHSGWARRFVGEEMEVVAQVSPDDFRELFADFGFDLARYQDPNSLSYVIEPKKGYPILMIDTNLYSDEESTKSPTAEGEISAETFTWLETYFAMQSAKYLVGHHPLLSHDGSDRTGHTLQNAADALALLLEQDIDTSFAGHIHAQNISSKGDFKEIVTGALSINPNSMGEIILNDEALDYTQRNLDVAAWAVATGQTEDDLLSYDQTSHDLFYDDAATMGLMQMFEEQWYDQAYEADVMDFIGQLNVRYFAGDDFERSEYLEEHPGYGHIQANSSSFLKRYSTRSLRDTDLDDRQISIPHKFLVK